MTRPGPAAFVFDHFEKPALAVALLALCFVAIRFALPPPTAGLDVDDLLRKRDRIVAHAENGRVQLPPIGEIASVAPRVKRQLDPAQTVRVRAFPTWLMHRRPHFFTEERRRTVPTVRHAAPDQLTADASRRDRIDLTWRAGSDSAHVDLRPFEVERSVTDPDFTPTGKRPLTWKVVARIGPDGPLTWRDERVQAGRAYRYRVTGVATIDSEDAAVREFGLTLDPKQARKRTEIVGPFVPKPRFYVRVLDGTPNQDQALRFHGAGKVDVRRYPKVGRADLRFWVWSPAGFTEAVVFGVTEGAPIHKTRGRGERKTVVLETGCTLRRVRLAKIDRAAGERTYQVVGVVVEIEGPDGRRWSIVQHQPLPEELARLDRDKR